ncbi:MAG: hypothetical protein JW889_12795 [Verrucomicrobia bacterium]|nr:hypothetical protein [Verrucomicrobiota bacterium]
MEPDRTGRRSFYDWFQALDRRYIYLVFFIFVIGAHFVPLTWPVTPAKHTRDLFCTVEAIPKDKAVVVDSDWWLGIRAESEVQLRALFHHVMRTDRKLVIMSWIWGPEAQKFAYDFAADVAKDYGREYGKDWIELSAMNKVGGAELASFARDIHGFVKTDVFGTRLDDKEKLPMMENIRNIYDIGLVVSFSYGFDTNWIGFIQGVYGTPFGVATSAIESSTAYPFIEARQICGMMASAPGAAEYEQLLELPSNRRAARQTVNVLSLAIVYVLFGILLSNLAYFGSLRKKR